MLISFTYYYTTALFLAVVGLIFLTHFIGIKRTEYSTFAFTLSASGSIYLAKDQQNYQLIASSRVSFIGCWLNMVASDCKESSLQKTIKPAPKQFFIFRDSLSKQDFSRISNVLKQLRK